MTRIREEEDQRNSGYRPSRVNIMAQGLHSWSLP